MEYKEIQELIKLVSKSNISGLKIKQGEFEISIENQAVQPTYISTPPMAYQPAVTPVVAAPVAATPAAESKSEEPQKPAADTAVNDNVFIFRSPMIGTFYRKPGADKDPYVKIGDQVKEGDVLCIIEAMKLFNEIEFDGGSGKIVKILVEDSSPVEYDQPLFMIEKA